MLAKKLGVISGMGTRAGILFLNKLLNAIEAPTDQDFPEIVLHNNSKIPDRTLCIVEKQESPNHELLRSVNMLNSCGVDYIVSTCITSYHFIDKFSEETKHNIINPIQHILKTVRQLYPNFSKIGLLATTGTLKSRLFQKIFKNTEFELITLGDYEQQNMFMESVYMTGGFKASTINEHAYILFDSALDVLEQEGAQLIIGGCTEAQIGYDHNENNIPYIDMVDVLINQVILSLGLVKNKKRINI